MIAISNRQRASLVGILILLAYSMLTYTITKNATLGVITDIISGLAVICIPLLMFSIFNTNNNKIVNYLYLISRFIEGILMIIGAIFILNPSLESYREFIYSDIHIYFFIIGALLFYILLYRTQVVPRFISIWGVIATVVLFIVTMVKLVGVNIEVLNLLVIPIVLNEIFLAIWLIVKGFNSEKLN